MGTYAAGLALALAVACAILGFVVERFGYELCHRGFPLATLVVAIPAVGAIAGLASLFRRSRLALAVLKVAALAVNSYHLVMAFIVLTGVGIISCR